MQPHVPAASRPLTEDLEAQKHLKASSLTKFGAPQIGAHADLGKLGKLAARVEKTLHDKVLFTEPKQLDPQSILVAPLNRDGAPPNVQHIHYGILKSFLNSGFDSTRPQIGICVHFKSAEGKRKLLEHNLRFTTGNQLLPRIEESKVLYGSLAGSHLNLALRLLQQGGHKSCRGCLDPLPGKPRPPGRRHEGPQVVGAGGGD